MLEFRYHRDVERAHGLPESSRQVPFTRPDGRRGFRDRVYTEYGVVVELDGRLAHPAENQWKDKARDNAAAAEGKQSLRYDWTQRAVAGLRDRRGGGQGAQACTAGTAVPGRARPVAPSSPSLSSSPAPLKLPPQLQPRSARPVTAASTRAGSVRSGRTTCAPARSAAE